MPLASVRSVDAALVGHKAAALAALLVADFPVPPGLCVTTGAFRRAIDPYETRIGGILRAHDMANPADAAAAARACGLLLADSSLPATVIASLRDRFPEFLANKRPLAVRSSATIEDRADASFAGQYASVLGVRAADDEMEPLEEAILTCWRSFFSANALAARAGHGGLGPDEAMAVLLQPIVEAECAGVAFSVDPVHGRADVAVVNAAWGLGQGVAEGSVATDTFWLLRQSEFAVERRRIVSQRQEIVVGKEGMPQTVALPADRASAAALPEAWAQRIAQFAVAAEVLRERPQEIEWAVADNHFWLLQSRPLAGLPPALAGPLNFPVRWAEEEEGSGLWRLTKLARPENDLLLPLEHDYIRWRNVASAEGRRFTGQRWLVRAKVIHGRLYMNHFPSDLSPGDRRARAAAMRDLAQRLHYEGQTPWDYWGPEVVAACERLAGFDVAGAGSRELARFLEEAAGVFRRHWTVHPILWEGYSPTALHDAYAAVTGRSAEEGKAELADLVHGEENVLTRLVDDLYELAQAGQRERTVAKLLGQTGQEEVGDLLVLLKGLPAAAPFLERLDQFLDEYGDRVGSGYGSEVTLTEPTWRERPELVLRLAASFLKPEIEPPAKARARRQEAREKRVEALCSACDDATAVSDFRRELVYARRRAAMLEDHNHYIDQVSHGQLRRALLAAARHFVDRGVLSVADDLFWLRYREILDALRADSPSSFADVIAARKAENARWRQMTAPPLLGVPDSALPERPPLGDDVTSDGSEIPGRLLGQPASAGRKRGRARVVADDVALPDLAPGDVLVAENAGPRWTPLFPILGGLVLDGGALGQHAAATAREYGVPAVIGTGDATRRISDGAWVMVDGGAGTVEIEESPPAGEV